MSRIRLFILFMLCMGYRINYAQSYDTAQYARKDFTLNISHPEIGQYIRLYPPAFVCFGEKQPEIWDTLVRFCNQLPYCVFELASFTDCRASKDYNLQRSQTHAENYRDTLIKHGLDSFRLTAKGFGESKPLNHCTYENDRGDGMNCTESEHQQNRRMELSVSSILTRKELWDHYVMNCTIDKRKPDFGQGIRLNPCFSDTIFTLAEKIILDSIVDLFKEIPGCYIKVRDEKINGKIQKYLAAKQIQTNANRFLICGEPGLDNLGNGYSYNSLKTGIIIYIVNSDSIKMKLWNVFVTFNSINPYHADTGQFIRFCMQNELDNFCFWTGSLILLDTIMRFITFNSNLTYEIGSYSDCRASNVYNDTLTKRKSEQVVDMLVYWGVDQKILKAVGYGERKLLNHCSCENNEGPGMDCNETAHQLNRRTEIKIIDIRKQ